MKSLVIFLSASLLLAFTVIQNSSWAEAKNFHGFMSATFHPAEKGDFKPLKEKSDSLAVSANKWAMSPIPSNYKEKETKEALALLAKQTKQLAAAVKAGKPDAELLKMITAAHDTFHKIVGECRKDEKH